MTTDVVNLDELKLKIAALKAQYMRELAPLLAELDAGEKEEMRRQGLFDLDATEEDLANHLIAME